MSEQSTSPATTTATPEASPAFAPLMRMLEAASRAIGVQRVFGEPIETPAGSVIPVATVMGGQGVGYGDSSWSSSCESDDDEATDTPGSGSGGGGGFGVLGWPAGAYVTQAGQTRWQPSVDANLVILGASTVAGCLIAAIASVSVAKAIGRTAVTLAGNGAETVTALADSGSRCVSALANTAAETTTSLGGMARDSFATAATSASETTLSLAVLGAKTLVDSTALVTRSLSAGLDSLASAVRRGD